MAIVQTDWTDEELEACLQAYLEMLGNEIAGQTYNKAEFNRKLRAGPLGGRSRSSIEFRMQNIFFFHGKQRPKEHRRLQAPGQRWQRYSAAIG